MAEPTFASPPPKRRKSGGRIDPLAVVAAGFFLLAIVGSTFPAFQALRTGAQSAPGILLLIGLAGVAFLGLFAFATTELRETASPASEESLSSLVDALPEPAAVAGADGRLACANPAWRKIMGESRRLPKSPSSSLYSALAAARRQGAGEARIHIGGEERGVVVSRLDGDRLLVRLPTARTLEVVRLLPDVNPPAAAAQVSTAESPAALDPFAAAAPFGAALLDGNDPFEAAILQANGALSTLTEGAATPGAPFGALIDPSSRTEARSRLINRPGGPVEVRLALDTPKIAHLYVTRAEDRLVVYLLDVSEQKQLELQLAQSQKMQAIGQLAGGVAHDFNNLLTAIQLRLDELLHRHPVGDPSYEGLNEIRQTAVRAADLVRKLLAFSRKQTVQRETLELGELISEFEVLLRRLLREDVKLVTDYGRDLPLVRADKSQLETAVMNLAVNARDALRSHGSGDGGPPTVKIRTARLTQGEARQLGFSEAPKQGCALIEVSDNGPGIPADVMSKIFEPFFTTKPVGEGTGLGLATVYGIVKQADGYIHVESEPVAIGGKGGAAFRVFLPIHTPVANAEPARPALKFKPAPRDLSGAGRILFVEDEDAVRGVAARLLRARGYEVIEASDGEEALALCKEHAGTIDLLISDVVMPEMDGPTLLKQAREYLGTARVMFISGYAEAEFSDLLEGEEGVTFLPKPIDIKILAERVKQQLQS
jgi:two-component system cell cycle sensor histidine kinase/response regulator CckA